MDTPSSLIDNRTIRVFISSTFSDMNDERTELMKKTFPRLRVMAAKRDVTLTEVDLRWGITKEESESGRVVDICLREIQNSIPFFIGIIGNRYGWVPSRGDIEESTFDRFDQVRSYVERKLSVTDMEMQFGVLEHKEDLHAFFYINDNKEERDNNPEKLADLKRVVRTNGRYPVSDFSSPEDLAKQVEEAFVRLLDELFPENHSLSFLEKERISQRSFLNQLSQCYVRVKENFEKLDNFLADENQQYQIVTGESGLGKSALVANWVKGLIDKKQTNRKIIYHFIGNGGSLASHHHVVKTLCAELKDQFKLEAPFDERDKEKWSKEDTDTLELIYSKISVDKEGCLIVLDAVNQIVDMDNAKNMLWLGFPPRNVKVLITTLDNDVTMGVFKRRESPVFELKALGLRQRRKLVKDYLKDSYGKHLTDDQVAAIINDRQSSNTLVLKTLLDELVSFGSFVDLENRVQYYLEPDSIPDFYQRVIERFEHDFGRETVSHVLTLILLSREGLPEDAITEIAKLKPLLWSQLYCSLISHLNVKNGLVNFSHQYFSKAVQLRYNCSNHLLYSGPYLPIGVREVNEQSEKERQVRKEIVSYYRLIETEFSWSEVGYQYELLRDYKSLYALLMQEDTFQYFYDNDRVSLTRWWNELIHDADSSVQFHLADYLNLESKNRETAIDLLLCLSEFAERECVDLKMSLAFAEKALEYAGRENDVFSSLVYNRLGSIYLMQGNYIKGLESSKKELSLILSEYGDGHPDVVRGYNNVGVAYSLCGNYQKAIEYKEIALSKGKIVLGGSHPSVATYYANVGDEYRKMGDYQKALEYEEKALEIRLTNFGTDHPDVSDSYNSIGLVYCALGDHKKALDYKEKALSIITAYYNMENHPSIAHALFSEADEYIHLGDYLSASEGFASALTMYLSIFDENCPIVADTFTKLGYVSGKLGSHQEALEDYEKALRIRVSLYGHSHPLVAGSYLSIEEEYLRLSRNKSALKYFLKAFMVFVRRRNGKMVAALFDCVGRSYKNFNQVEKANDFFRRAAEKWEVIGCEEQAQKSLSEIVENK